MEKCSDPDLLEVPLDLFFSTEISEAKVIEVFNWSTSATCGSSVGDAGAVLAPRLFRKASEAIGLDPDLLPEKMRNDGFEKALSAFDRHEAWDKTKVENVGEWRKLQRSQKTKAGQARGDPDITILSSRFVIKANVNESLDEGSPGWGQGADAPGQEG